MGMSVVKHSFGSLLRLKSRTLHQYHDKSAGRGKSRAMSYILDALKKAERERGIAQVPTLATVHEVALRPRMRIWIISGILVSGMALVLWIVIPRVRNGTEPLQSGTGEPNRAKESAAVKAETDSLQAPEVSAPQDPRLSREIPIDEMRTGFVPNNALVPRSMANAPSAIIKPQPLATRQGQPAKKESASSPGSYVPGIPADDAAEDSQANTELGDSTNVVQSSGKAQGLPVSLREAMSGMSISVLSFSEIKGERFVFINGRKYFEGDYVQGDYLLESITQDGAVLSYKGERAILRPDSK
jgi:general secretion pathway protein B